MKLILSSFVAIFFAVSTFGQGFYDLHTIQEIKITFAQSNWDALLDAQKAGAEDYIMAQSVEINGTVYDSVGVKYKGNSTYRATQVKNPYHIELDTYKEQDHEGYTDIKLSNVANDPSFVREVLSYQILRQYMDAPLCNYANVYVNGTLIGLYSNAESVSKKFVNSRFGSKKNTFVKCNPPAGAGPGTTDYPNLTYLGTDSSKYFDSYEMKSDTGWNDFVRVIDVLNNQTNDFPRQMNINRVLWMHAFNNVFVNLDSYSGGFAQNYYLYKDDNDIYFPIVWDLNESFGRFTQTGSASIRLRSTADKQRLTHLLHKTDADYPLISKLLADPTYERMYIAHCKTILEENFANGSYLVTGDTLQSTIDAAVQADANKFFTYANFTANLRSDITSGGGPGGGTTNGVGNLMDGRSSYLLGLADFTATTPTIAAAQTSNAAPALRSKFFLTSNVTNENLVLIGYRFQSDKPFVIDTLFDDGNHGDGAANDGNYGIELTMNGITMEYYLYAENNNAGLFSPRRAEQEFHVFSLAGGLVINEVMSSNDQTIQSDAGTTPDWIEVYNPGNTAIDLSEYYLSDDSDDPTQYNFPKVNLPAKGYQVVWASGDETLSEWNAGFKLSKSGESLGLYFSTQGDTVEADFIDIPALNSDDSYGRETDGAENWIVFDIATPNDTNRIITKEAEEPEDTTSIEQVLLEEIRCFPNPAQDKLTIDLGTNNAELGNLTVKFSDITGRSSMEVLIIDQLSTIDLSELSRGVYVLTLSTESGARRIEKLVKE